MFYMSKKFTRNYLQWIHFLGEAYESQRTQLYEKQDFIPKFLIKAIKLLCATASANYTIKIYISLTHFRPMFHPIPLKNIWKLWEVIKKIGLKWIKQ